MLLSFGMTLASVAVVVPPSMASATETDWFASHASTLNQPLAKRLQTHDQTELIMVLDELSPGADTDRNARAVSDLLRSGQTDVVTDHALDALARLRSREGRDVLMGFLHHRRVEARMRAYSALAELKDSRDASVIALGLRDSAPQVRSDAARRLGELRARSAAPDLQRALELGVNEASAALGKLGDAAALERFTTQLGKLPLPVMLEGYANFLERPDLPDASKLAVIAALEEVSGSLVKDFLQARSARPAPNTSPQVQQAITNSASRVLRPSTTNQPGAGR
ncbi:MAG: HEAT repeat domain-containing protein [Polyangiales bacterium]